MVEREDSQNDKKKKVKPGSFQGLNLSKGTYKAIMRMGYKMPTPIQRRTIPTILDGQDLVAMARTGSGKTAAFLIPIIERLSNHCQSVGIRAVVLSPTRELAVQTAKFARQLGRNTDLRYCLLVGGQSLETQFEHLANNPDVVVATPGRLMHHILEVDLSLARTEMLVFDEADRLFELGFAEQLEKILEKTPTSRQCLLFSATLPQQLVAFSRAGVKNPVFVRLDVESTLSESLDLWYLYVRKDEKLAATVAALRHLHEEKKSTVMFVATRHHVEFFGEFLPKFGLSCSIVYGTMDPVARTEQVEKFRKHKARILVTTDVAARGIDIPFLDHVLNFDFPPSAKLFVHRSGRTARAGRSGVCASLVTLEDMPYAVELMLFLGHKLKLPPKASAVQEASSEEEVAAAGTTKTPMIGSVPGLEHLVEQIQAYISEDGSVLESLYKSMMASYSLYNKTRPTASKQSVARAKQMLSECGGATALQTIVHPALRDNAADSYAALPKGDLAGDLLVQHLRGFRPKAEKIGNVISTDTMRKMEQVKLDVEAVAMQNEKAESILQNPVVAPEAEAKKADEAEAAKQKLPVFSRDKPRVSKRRRQKMGKDGGGGGEQSEDDGFDVKVDGKALGGKDEAKIVKGEAPEQFYLSVERDATMDAKERGLEMEQYQMDLMPDDGSNIQKAKSVIRWDAKKKKYLPVMVSADGRVLKKTVRHKNEAGVTVRGDKEKTDAYKKWAKSTKMRIQRIGEIEEVQNTKKRKKGAEAAWDEATAVPDTMPNLRPLKPVVPYHGVVGEEYLTHKQKRLLKRREKYDTILSEGSGVKSEVKTPHQLAKERKTNEKKKMKQNPKLGRRKNAEWKKKHMATLEEKQLKKGARTRSRMLVFEGGGASKKKQRSHKMHYV